MRTISTHMRRHVVAYLALFLALSGTAWAGAQLTSGDIAKNAIRSKHIKKGQVKGADVATDALTGADIDEAGLTGVDADRLDGRDSTAFHLGGGQTSSGALTATVTGSQNESVHLVPGLLRVHGICSHPSDGVNLGIGNVGNAPMTVFVDSRSRPVVDIAQVSPDTGAFAGEVTVGDRVTWLVSSAGRRAVVTAISHRTDNGPSSTCSFQAQVTTSGGPS